MGVGTTLSVGDATPGNGTAVLLLAAVRLLVMQICGGADACGSDDHGGLYSLVVYGGGGRWQWAVAVGIGASLGVRDATLGKGMALLLSGGILLLAMIIHQWR